MTALLLAFVLAAFAAFAVHSLLPLPSGLDALGPKPALAEPGTYAIHTYHKTSRGTVITRWGYHDRYDNGFGYRHIIGGEHGWYPNRITDTISKGYRNRNYERRETSRTYEKWYRIPNGRFLYRVTYDTAKTRDGKMKGVITAFVVRTEGDNPNCIAKSASRC